jgi:hypothetical protein
MAKNLQIKRISIYKSKELMNLKIISFLVLLKINFAGLLGFRVPKPLYAINPPAYPVSEPSDTMTRHNNPKWIFHWRKPQHELLLHLLKF